MYKYLLLLSFPLYSATFFPVNTQAALNAAILTANTNGVDDIIDLSNKEIILTELEPGATTNGLRPILSDTSHKLTIRNGTLTRDSNSAFAFRILQVSSGADLSIDRLRLRNGLLSGASDLGGAILVASGGKLTSVSNSVFDNNFASSGGAISYGDLVGASTAGNAISETQFYQNSANANGGAIVILGGSTIDTISRSDFIKNTVVTSGTATAFGGALTLLVGNITTIDAVNFLSNTVSTTGTGSTYGGAISLRGTTAGSTIGEIKNSTFYDNAAGFSGGAIHLVGNGATFLATITKLISSTFSQNRSSGIGGAIGIDADGVITGLFNSTIASNTAVTAGGGIHFSTAANVTRNTIGRLASTIVALNTATTGPNIFETATGNVILANESFNLIGINNGSFIVAGTPNANSSYVGTTAIPIDPLLGALASNGGRTQTREPLGTSLAIDRGANLATPALTVDQRGASYARVRSSQIDIGAVEIQLCADSDFDGKCDDLDSDPLYPNPGSVTR